MSLLYKGIFSSTDRKVLQILLEVEVAWREASISLEDHDADKKREINKRKQQIIDGEDETIHSKKAKKAKLKKNLKFKNKKHKKNSKKNEAVNI